MLLSALAFWAPWGRWDVSVLGLLGLENEDSYAGLQIYSIAGEIEVEIDNEVVGNVTEEGSPLDIFEIEPGDHLVTVTRVSTQEDPEPIYYKFRRMITFVQGINTVIAYEIGPSERYSSGYVIYTVDGIKDGTTHLSIRTVPANAKIYINDIEISDSPVNNYELDLAKEYTIKIVKDNYEEIAFSLLPEAAEERELLVGYDLNVDVNLFELPLETRYD